MEENKFDELYGRFTRLIYSNGLYSVYRFEDKQEGAITVTGYIDEEIDIKSDYFLYGEFINHPKFGFQFNISRISRSLPNSYDGIISYLSSDIFKGIGKKKAMKIVEHFKDDCLAILKKDPYRIEEVELNDKDKETIIEVFKTDMSYEETFYFLTTIGLSALEINLIVNKYKDNIIELIKENPYRLYFDINGIGFKKADDIARKLNIENDNPYRLVALMSFVASDLSFRTGNTFHYYNELFNHFVRFENHSLFDIAIEKAIEQEKIYCVNDRFYHFKEYIAEREIAKFLIDLNNQVTDFESDDLLNEEIERIENEESIVYDDKQFEAIRAFYSYPVSIIIGGPGTGKTTIVKAMVKSIKKIFPLYELHIVAPTGRAAKRIGELCDVKASTIHSLLKWDKESNSFTHGIDNPLLIDMLIVDEFSMVDNWLFYKLISALYHVKKICIIGDHNQLPSVGPGNLLHDLITSDLFHVTHLNHIFRQSDGSGIISLADDILNNDVNFNRYQDDVLFIDDVSINVQKRLVEMIKNNLNNGYTLDDIQVLSPMYKGAMGIDASNSLLQDTFNPKSSFKNEYRSKYRIFRENDKILQLKNQSSDDIFNGDIGFIQAIEKNLNKNIIIGRFDDNFIEYDESELNKIALAYCISVHKSQGSEYDIVYFLVSNEHQIMMYKKLIYTAISRASHKLIIVGSKEAFLKGISKEIKNRQTSLILFLNQYS